MDLIKKIFPFSFRGKQNGDLIVAIVLYLVACAVASIVIKLTSVIPIVGWIVGIILGCADLYAVIGIILAVLYRIDAIKD